MNKPAEESEHPAPRVLWLVVAYFGYYMGYVFAALIAFDILNLVLSGEAVGIGGLAIYGVAFVLLQKIALRDRRNDD